jgi:hypothetical protein
MSDELDKPKEATPKAEPTNDELLSKISENPAETLKELLKKRTDAQKSEQIIKVTPQNECNDGQSRILAVKINLITHLPEELETGVKIYPNPSSGKVYIELKDPKIWKVIRLINSLGQVIQDVELGLLQQKIEFENLNTGFYIIQLQNRNEVKQFKVIVKK